MVWAEMAAWPENFVLEGDGVDEKKSGDAGTHRGCFLSFHPKPNGGCSAGCSRHLHEASTGDFQFTHLQNKGLV
uniref:Uncharacterized protein n=1 Tax=Pseudomonas putida TaxID=303 RepID=A0A223Q361_PSEPU|nr:Hypothetical protein [Pseudomonas putida]